MLFTELMAGMFESSKLMILDFAQIPKDASAHENLAQYFATCQKHGIDPKTPPNRQKFNDRLLAKSRRRYLVARYGEDRRSVLAGSSIAAEDRTIHLGIDVYSAELEPIYAPCDGEIVQTGCEPGPHSYGYYLVVKVDGQKDLYVFLGHLGKALPQPRRVKAGDKIARLGDYKNGENGGWSRHLHLQMLTELPPEAETPIGYSSKADFAQNSQKYPNPLNYFKNWRF